MKNTIDLVPLGEDLITSYGPGGRTFDTSGKPWPYSRLLPVRRAGGGNVWRASMGTAHAIDRLVRLMALEGAKVLALTEVWRDQVRVQAPARDAYMRWVNAGRPAPRTPGWHPSMKAAYVAPAGQSNHGWGGAIDIGLQYLRFDKGGKTLVGNEALALFWELAEQCGFTPIVRYPKVNQSEAWHFDHWGPLSELAHRNGYGYAAAVGCLLAGQSPGSRPMQRYLQARLAFSGADCGALDGIIGSRTLSAYKAVTGTTASAATPLNDLIAALDECGAGVEAIVEL